MEVDSGPDEAPPSRTVDAQIALNDGANLVSYLRLRPGGSSEHQILGEDFPLEGVLTALEPALEIAWTDRPEQVSDLDEFLEEAYQRFVASADDLATESSYIEAARWTVKGRNHLLDHLRHELDAVLGGVEAEELWQAFGSLVETAPLTFLIENGIQVTFRSLASFLVDSSNKRFDDELCAADFFPIGEWENIRDEQITAHLVKQSQLVNKQVAHLTHTRPRVEEITIYRPRSYRDLARSVVEMLDQFTAAVDTRLLPDWWSRWLADSRERCALGE